MDYIQSDRTDPAFNLALEQYVFDALPRDRSYLMLWQNDHTIVIGKYQNAYAEINAGYVREHHIRVARRLSGGGAVYHDLGNMNFTFITDADAIREINFRLFCEPIIETIASYGVKAELSGRNDITVDGKKFSGNSQYIKEGRVMHHGTIMLCSDLSAVAGALRVDPGKIESKGVQSVRSRVMNLCDAIGPVTVEDFRGRLLETIGKRETLRPYTLTEEDLRKVEELRAERYGTYEWNYGKSPEGTLRSRVRIPGVGGIECRIDVSGGRIGDARLYGDFFVTGNLEELQDALRGIQFTREDVEAALTAIYDRCHIQNLSPAELAEQITG